MVIKSAWILGSATVALMLLMILDPYGDIYPCWDFVDHEEHRVGSFYPEVKLDKNSMDLWRGEGERLFKRIAWIVLTYYSWKRLSSRGLSQNW